MHPFKEYFFQILLIRYSITWCINFFQLIFDILSSHNFIKNSEDDKKIPIEEYYSTVLMLVGYKANDFMIDDIMVNLCRGFPV